MLIDIAGWSGVVVLLIAYGLVSTKRIEGDAVMYQLLNLVGAILLVVNSSYHDAYPSVVVNVIWAGIAIFALWKKRKSL